MIATTEGAGLLQGRTYDVAIIGGGASGTAIARDAAGRGLSVYLCEAGDLASGASSAGASVVHGRLRAMERLRVGAMRTAVAEREILLRSAPHLVRPARFVIPHHAALAPPAMMRFGLFLFDRFAGAALPPSAVVAHDDPAMAPLKAYFSLAFSTWDCLADDARLVVLNALDAATRGASINPRTRCVAADRGRECWRLSVTPAGTDGVATVDARILVNAAGGEAGDLANRLVQSTTPIEARLTRFVSLAVRWPHEDAGAYALFDAGGRVVHVVPFGPGVALVGAAMAPHVGPASAVTAGEGEVRHLADVVAQYFERPLRRSDILATWASVAAGPSEPSQAAETDRVLVDPIPGIAPMITAFGDDLTGNRRLAELAVDRMGRFLPVAPAWTDKAALPGGGFPPDGLRDLQRALRAAYPFLGEAHARRLAESYGTRATAILTGARSLEDLGARFGDDLTEAEVRFLWQEEWAETAEDVLWRRTRLGFVLLPDDVSRLEAFMATLGAGEWRQRALR